MNSQKAIALSKSYKTLLEKNGINTRQRKAMFFAQLDHESNLVPQAENLNYSAERLIVIFPKYFNVDTAKEYARQPQRIANRVYANRMGNGSEASNDGWHYRGRGFIQLTGKSNYTELSESVGVDYIKNPNLLINEADSMIAACWFWTKNGLNKLSDLGDVTSVTKRINGGTNGLKDRQIKYNNYLNIF